MAAYRITLPSAVLLHVLTLQVLGERRARLSPYVSRSPPLTKRYIQYVGLSSAFTLFLVSWNPGLDDIYVSCVLRVACFFYACKTLDLAVVQAEAPPIRMIPTADGSKKAAPMQSLEDRFEYTWALLTSMRYHNFDKSVEQKKRELPNNIAWTVGPTLVLAPLVYLVPMAELKCALILSCIHLGLEISHKLVHPSCGHSLFYRPFSASTLSDFWATHWQGAASPFLQSLAYKPVRRLTGSRAAAVLAAFNLSGIWHGWAVASLSDSPWPAVRMWMLFIGMGIGCLAERWIWGAKQGGMVQRVLVWAYALGLGGWWWRDFECHCKVRWVRTDRC